MPGKNLGLGLKILKTIGVGIAFSAASILAPQFPYFLLKAKLKQKFNKNYGSRELVNSINYLKRKKFIAYTNGRYVITKIGRKHILKAEQAEITITRLPWDNLWRMVSFDIPEESKPARLTILRKLKQLGFYHFQRSLFVIPWPCEKEIKQLALILGVAPHVHVFLAKRFTNDQGLVEFFELRESILQS